MANAVRDNPERAEFVGYDTQQVRFLQLVLSSFFAGVSGALSCINFEIVSAENVSAIRSGGVLIATFIGGVPFFFGPIVGAIVFVFFVVALSGFTKAWLLYLGLFFVLMVLYAPGGLASLILMQFQVIRAGRWRELLVPYALAALAGLLALAGVIGLVEMVYRLSEPARARCSPCWACPSTHAALRPGSRSRRACRGAGGPAVHHASRRRALGRNPGRFSAKMTA